MTDTEFLLEYAKHVPPEFPKQAERLKSIAAKVDRWTHQDEELRKARVDMIRIEDTCFDDSTSGGA